MLRAVASLHALRAFVMRAPDKNSRAQANYSGAFLSILRAVAFCTRVFVKFKMSGTVYGVYNTQEPLFSGQREFVKM